MSTLSVSSITGVTNVTGSIFDAMGTTANNANAQSIAAFTQANAAFNAANTANTTAASAGVPTGGIIYWAGASAPTGFLPCDGNIYTRTTYSSLASALGTPPMPSSLTFEYSNTSTANGFLIASEYPVLTSANNLLILSMRSTQSGNAAVSGNIYTSTDGTTWTARTGASIRAYSSGGVIQYIRFKNNAWAASNGANGPYVVFTTANSTYPNLIYYQTSTDQGATWTQRSINYYRANASIGNYPSGFAAGGTQGAYLAGMGSLFSISVGCCSVYYPQTANVAWSADGITWLYKDLWTPPTQAQGGSPIIPLFGTTPNGVITLLSVSGIDAAYYGNATYGIFTSNNSTGNGTVFWSANGYPSTWCDVTQNIRDTLGITATAQTSPLLYNIFSCNNEIIIPAGASRFLVSSNGANGTWRVVKYESGIQLSGYAGIDAGAGGDYQQQGVNFFTLFHAYHYGYGAGKGNQSAASSIVHNGDVYLFQNFWGDLFYSKDLRVWFRKDDYLTPMRGGYGIVSGTYTPIMGMPVTIPSLKKVVMVNKYRGGIFSFTTSGAYTAATQFPVPEIGADITMYRAFNTSWVPLKAYIKT